MPAQIIKTQCKNCGKKIHLCRDDHGAYIALRPQVMKAGVEMIEHRCKHQKMRDLSLEK